MRSESQKRETIRGTHRVVPATLIIAVALIALLGIGGYLYGVFASGPDVANVLAVNVVAPPPATLAASPALEVAGCGPNLPNPPYVALVNLGTANAASTSISVTFGGSVVSASIRQLARCVVPVGGSTEYIAFTLVYAGAKPSVGSQFSGSVAFDDGELVTFSGAFR